MQILIEETLKQHMNLLSIWTLIVRNMYRNLFIIKYIVTMLLLFKQLLSDLIQNIFFHLFSKHNCVERLTDVVTQIRKFNESFNQVDVWNFYHSR